MGVPLYPISQSAAAYKIPKAGADGKIASGFIPDLSGAIITSGLLALARGGTNADLSATGAATHFLRQASAGAAITVGAISAADLTAALTTPPAIGGTTPAAGKFTSLIVDDPADTTTLTLTQTYIEHLVPGSYVNQISFSGQSITLLPHLGGTGAVFAGNAGATSFALAAIKTASISSRYGAAFSQLRISSALYPASTSTPATVFTVFDTPGNSDISDNTTRLALFNGTDGKVLLVPTGASKVGVGLAFADTPASKMHILDTTAGSLSSVVNTVTIGRNTSDTPIAAGFGVGIAFTLKSSTTNDQAAAAFEAAWNVSTHASRASDLIDYVYYISTKQEAIRRRGASGAPQLGFYGATPVSKPALGAWAGLTTDQKLDALRDAMSGLGLASYT